MSFHNGYPPYPPQDHNQTQPPPPTAAFPPNPMLHYQQPPPNFPPHMQHLHQPMMGGTVPGVPPPPHMQYHPLQQQQPHHPMAYQQHQQQQPVNAMPRPGTASGTAPMAAAAPTADSAIIAQRERERKERERQLQTEEKAAEKISNSTYKLAAQVLSVDTHASASASVPNPAAAAAPAPASKPAKKSEHRMHPYKHIKTKNTLRNQNSEFTCRMRFISALPPIQSMTHNRRYQQLDSKLLAYPFDSRRFTEYNGTSLEKTYKYQLHTDVNMGIHIDLIDPLTYQTSHGKAASLPPEDLALLSDDDTAKTQTSSTASPSGLKRHVPSWLRKTEYMTQTEEIRFGVRRSAENVRPTGEVTGAQRVDAIEDQFAKVKSINVGMRHPTKKDLFVEEVYPVFPNFNVWNNVYNQVAFDADPVLISQHNRRQSDSDEIYRNAIIYQYDDKTGSGSVRTAYLLPSKNADTDDEMPSNYDWVREYICELDNSGAGTASYFLVLDPESGNAEYVDIIGRLSMQRAKVRAAAEDFISEESLSTDHPSNVLVNHQPYDEADAHMFGLDNSRADLIRSSLDTLASRHYK